MTKNRKNQKADAKVGIWPISEGQTATVNQRFSLCSIGSLHAQIEDLEAEEGILAKVKNWKVDAVIRHVVPTAFTTVCTVWAMAVQTAGTITEATDLSGPLFDDILDGQVDDVFAWRLLGKSATGRLCTVVADNSSLVAEARLSFNIPSDILALLHKEAETERLQSIYLVLLVYHSVAGAVQIQGHSTISWIGVRKTLTFR